MVGGGTMMLRDEIEITPAMIEAGANVIWRDFGDVIVFGSDVAREVASRVFAAMIDQDDLKRTKV
jgi:hypothetical protein